MSKLHEMTFEELMEAALNCDCDTLSPGNENEDDCDACRARTYRLLSVAYSREHDEIVTDNANLREYITAIAKSAYEGHMTCNECRFFDQCYNGEPAEHEGRGCKWVIWARELGVEVS